MPKYGPEPPELSETIRIILTSLKKPSINMAAVLASSFVMVNLAFKYSVCVLITNAVVFAALLASVLTPL